jgi:soluble lytic murein transglycosylase-like protein
VEALIGFAIAAALAFAAPANAGPADRWSGDVAEASARFGVPADWIRRVMHAESGARAMQGGRPIASSAGAMGLMQLMPGTWRDMRGLLGLGADPYDPRDNILAGTAYLRLMYDRFGYPGLFAAYNAGPARYALALAGQRRLPPETRAYVAKVAGPRRAVPDISAAVATGPRAGLFAVAPASDRPPALAAPLQRSGSLFVELGGSGR